MKGRIAIGLILTCLVSLQLNAQKPKAYRLKVGDKFVVTADITQHVEQDMLGQKLITEEYKLTVDEYEVVKQGKGIIRLKTTGLRRKLTSLGLTNVDLDSDGEGEKNDPIKVLVGKSYYITINDYGKVLNLEGLEGFRKQVRDELKTTTVASYTTRVLDQIDEEVIKSSFETLFYIYSPDGRKKWHRESEMTLDNMSLSVSTDFVREKGKKLVAKAQLSFIGVMEVEGKGAAAEMKGTQVSTFVLDKKTGLIKSAEITQDITAELNLQNFDLPMTIDAVTKVAVTW